MLGFFRSAIRPLIQKCGVDIVRYQAQDYPPDFSEEMIAIYHTVKPYTLTSPERVHALIDAVKYIVANRIEGSFVECGVWRGGSTMAMALALNRVGDLSRDIYLYDTFSGMTAPSECDISFRGVKALDKYVKVKSSKVQPKSCKGNPSEDERFLGVSPLDEVKENVFGTGYPRDKFHFVQGKVEDTIPGDCPKDIALLRLDTDWYGSTKHELTHLFPALKPRGVLIIDDYGYWQGSRKATDEYIREEQLCILLDRIDHSGRIAVKSPSLDKT